MVSLQLMRLIERHSDELATGLSRILQESDRTSDFRKIPPEELLEATASVYRHLGEWILRKTEADIAKHFGTIGAKRAIEGIGLHQFVWAVSASRNHLWEFLRSNAFADNIVALYGEMELQERLNQFFDRAMYFGVLGYMEAERQHGHSGEHRAKLEHQHPANRPPSRPTRAPARIFQKLKKRV